MKRLSKNFKIFATILCIAIVIGIGIALVSKVVYGKVYFFDGYTITKILWGVVMLLGLVGSVGTIIYGIKDIVRLAKGQPLPNERSNVNANGQPQITINQQMSQSAQFEYNKRKEKYKESGKELTDQIEACLFAQAVEVQLLKAPASAVFCEIEEMNVSLVNGVYVVSGYVDSQNSYGAMVRTPFTLNVTKDDGSWKSVDRFVNSNTTIATAVAANTVLYWIIGFIITVILSGVIFFILRLF